MLPGIFLDRDGVIIEHRPEYVRSWSDVVFYPQALSALARLQSRHYKIAIITNQSAIGRGLINAGVAADINRRIEEEIVKAGGRIDGIFVCPHQPQDGCLCRKPRPGLILKASEALDIDLTQSILIGDNMIDLQAGQAAGVPRLALVRSGLGALQVQAPFPEGLREFSVYADLEEALQFLVP
jgi:D-glycero-D-manno-heptose 1,7-bisphosphate phosphatase